ADMGCGALLGARRGRSRGWRRVVNDLRDEGVTVAAERRLECPGRRRKVGRVGAARYVGAAGGVHGDSEAAVLLAAADEGGVDEGRARGIELRHEGVEFAAAVSRLEGPRYRREVDRIGC